MPKNIPQSAVSNLMAMMGKVEDNGKSRPNPKKVSKSTIAKKRKELSDYKKSKENSGMM